MITQELAAYGYLIAAICFIMALRGLSSPVTSRQGNLYGVVGMVVAIGVTIATPGVVSPWLIVGGLLVGGAIGTFIVFGLREFLSTIVPWWQYVLGIVYVATILYLPTGLMGIPERLSRPRGRRDDQEEETKLTPAAS